MADTRKELEQYAKKLLRERETTLHANTINQIVERDWRDYITYLAEQVSFGVSIADAHIALDAMADKFSSNIAQRYTEKQMGAKPALVYDKDMLGERVPKHIEELIVPYGYTLRELSGGELPRAIRLLISEYWSDIIEHGLYEFFTTHPVFGVDYVDKELMTAFVTQIYDRYSNMRKAMTYIPDVRIPFHLDVVTGLEKAKAIIEGILTDGLRHESFRNFMEWRFDKYYADQAYIRGTYYSSPSEFISEFCYWILQNPPIRRVGETEERRSYRKGRDYR